MYKTIEFNNEHRNIGIIKLNRPSRKNAISIEMRNEISSCLKMIKDSEEINAVIITGTNTVFSAGFDLNEFNTPDHFNELFDSSSRYHRELWNFPKPTIAAINGPALGGGFDLAALCDIRICSDTAIFGHPEIKFGGPPIFTPLRWIVGDGIARDLCLTGRKIGAQEALRYGLVTNVISNEEVLNRSVEIARSILEAPVDTIKFTKAFLTGNVGLGFEESFFIEHDKAFREVLLKKAKEGFSKR